MHSTPFNRPIAYPVTREITLTLWDKMIRGSDPYMLTEVSIIHEVNGSRKKHDFVVIFGEDYEYEKIDACISEISDFKTFRELEKLALRIDRRLRWSKTRKWARNNGRSVRQQQMFEAEMEDIDSRMLANAY